MLLNSFVLSCTCVGVCAEAHVMFISVLRMCCACISVHLNLSQKVSNIHPDLAAARNIYFSHKHRLLVIPHEPFPLCTLHDFHRLKPQVITHCTPQCSLSDLAVPRFTSHNTPGFVISSGFTGKRSRVLFSSHVLNPNRCFTSFFFLFVKTEKVIYVNYDGFCLNQCKYCR